MDTNELLTFRQVQLIIPCCFNVIFFFFNFPRYGWLTYQVACEIIWCWGANGFGIRIHKGSKFNFG